MWPLEKMMQDDRTDAWAKQAAAWPLAFAQVREDPRLDLSILRQLPANPSVMMIASGGETAVCLAREPLQRLLLIDVNPAQLALTRCRLHLADNCEPQRSMALLGHRPMVAEERTGAWLEIFAQLNLAEECIASLPLLGELGPDHCGRYEAAFAAVRHLLQPFHNELRDFLTSRDPLVASSMIDTIKPLGQGLDAAFAQALSLGNLVCLFGIGATQNPRRPFNEHFLAQLRCVTSRMAPADNPWIWQLLEGTFSATAVYDWLANRRPILVQPEFVCDTMTRALDGVEKDSMDLIHLSNILDWLNPDEARQTLASARRVLKPGGYLIIRQLNSSLPIDTLDEALQWQTEQGRLLQAKDRSFFYPQIHIAQRL
jgi:S-adenosylmethionine-diacylglycerol 3-amino-3-carboxypropyl transferase